MTNRLIFIGGPPGVGKSSVAETLLSHLKNSVWLDGDDVWRMNPFEVNDKTKEMVIKNIQFVLNSFISTGFSFVLFTWVLHQNDIVDSIIKNIELRDYEFLHFTLICNSSILKDRILSDEGRTTDLLLAFDRLEQNMSMNSEIIDTSHKTIVDVANILINKIVS